MGKVRLPLPLSSSEISQTWPFIEVATGWVSLPTLLHTCSSFLSVYVNLAKQYAPVIPIKCHIITIYHVISQWFFRGGSCDHKVIPALSCYHYMISAWNSHDDRVIPMWQTHDHCEIPHDGHVLAVWFPPGSHMIAAWFLCGGHMIIEWFLC